MRLVAGCDQAVLTWMERRYGVTFQPPFVVLGIVHEDVLCGGVVLNDHYPGGNIELSYVGPGTLRPGIIKSIARHAFLTCGCQRITARTPRSNVIARKLLPRMGFSFESTQRRFFGPAKKDDALVFVLFRERAAKWLKGAVADEVAQGT